MAASSFKLAPLYLALVAVLAVNQQVHQVAAQNPLSGLLGGVAGTVDQMSNSLGVGNLVGSLTKPVTGMLGQLTGGLGNGLGGGLGGLGGGLSSLVSGATNALAEQPLTSGLSSLTNTLSGGLLSSGARAQSSAYGNQAAMASASANSGYGSDFGGFNQMSSFSNGLVRNNYKREAIASGLTAAKMAGDMIGGAIGANGNAATAAMQAAAMEGIGASNAMQRASAEFAGNVGENMASAAAASAASLGGTGQYLASQMYNSAQSNVAEAAYSAANRFATNGAAIQAAASALPAATAAAAAATATNAAAIEGQAALGSVAATNQVVGRQALAADALSNAQAEAAIAGGDMVAHGANNARSASLASNAYRQAKLATARDRVNVAGTIQNSARISDAAIATHDAATKAEDSLLGSELAVDSAATVLDSDAAYIPPVTSSLLRSLPYGRLGLRNIIPKPLTWPSVLLPDVWLNGSPVKYVNVPLRMLPYGIGSTAFTNQLYASGAALANGQIINGQPFIANNGMVLNGMVFDPAVAYLSTGYLNGITGSSVYPVLANGQLEAQDEIAHANMINMQLLGGAGMSATYQGYGRTNPVPLITGSVSDVNLMPTTTIGTTYPVGSALVVEPRDSYFQDYVDNASSRQNYDEHQQ